jgi:dipeptidyl aminopeptidase/acylaminoacyl peptidase
MKRLYSCLLLVFPAITFSQLPECDIWLMNITSKRGKIGFDHIKNVTHKNGYENQPSFSADGKTIYFTSQGDTLAGSDIYTYEVENGQTKQVTFSATSEYSPMITPAGDAISVVIVEGDKAQRIWQYPFSGDKPTRIFQRDSVGYYAWINEHSVLAFILSDGKTMAERLAVISNNGTEKKLADSIGRGIKVFGSSALFVKKIQLENYLYLTDYSGIQPLIKTPGKSQDFAVYKKYVLMAEGGLLYAAKMHLKNHEIVGLDPFVPVMDLAPYGMKKISRIAVSPNGKTMAVVTEDK